MMYVNGQAVAPTFNVGAGIEGGNNVTFKQNGVTKYIVSCMQGESITNPMPPSAYKWVDSNGNTITFPYTPLADIDLFYQATAETLMLHCDDYIDSGMYSLTLSTYGTSLSDSIKRFGTKSIYFNGSAYIDIDNSHFDFGTNDFTIDCWVYPTSSSAATVVGCWGEQYSYNFLVTVANSSLTFACSQNRSSMVVKTAGTLTLNTWQHIAVTRSGAMLYLFVNGVRVLSYELGASYTIATPNVPLRLGEDAKNRDAYTGYIDELRILNGTCAWTEDFTPPTQPY